MLKKIMLITTSMVLMYALAVTADANKKTMSPCCGARQSAEAAVGTAQTVCPVMGGEINKEIFVDYQGKRVYLCCEACVDAFQKDADGFMKKLAHAGTTLQDSPCTDDMKAGCCKTTSAEKKPAGCSTTGCAHQ